MPISRPLLIVLVAAVLALVGFYAMQATGGGSDSSEIAAPVVPAEPASEPADEPTSVAKVDESKPAPREDGKPDRAARENGKPDRAARQEAKVEPTAGQDAKADRAAAREAAATKAAARRRAREERLGMPLAVSRALNARRIVVLYFRGSPSADDRAAARAVASLRGERGVAVFTDRIGRLGRYRAVVGELGIAQAPAVVVVDRGRAARVVQGYIDPATLAQDVADAR